MGKLADLVSGESVAQWILIAALVIYFIYKEWPEFMNRIRGKVSKDIRMEEKSRYTHENFIYAKEIMDREGWREALVVSDPLHMKRAMLCASDFGVKAYPSPTPTTMYRSNGAKAKFLVRETGCLLVYGVWRVFGVKAGKT